MNEQTSQCCTREIIKKQKVISESVSDIRKNLLTELISMAIKNDKDSCCGDEGAQNSTIAITHKCTSNNADSCGSSCCKKEIPTMRNEGSSSGVASGVCKSGCCD